MSETKFEGADRLAEKRAQVMNTESGDLQTADQLQAMLYLLADGIVSILCAKCRRHWIKIIKQTLPGLLQDALNMPLPEGAKPEKGHLH
jgi:hypothetical protein